MKSHYFRNRLGRILLALSFLIAIGVTSSTVVQAQWPRDRRDRRERNRDYRRDRDRDDYSRNRDYRRNDQYGRNGGYGNGGYGNVSQVAVNQGFQDGLYTGSNDAQRGQSYNPQRSHFYRNGHSDNGNYGGGYGNSYQFQQAYRNGFLRGYDQGFQRYGGYNNNRRSNGNNGRFPFPW